MGPDGLQIAAGATFGKTPIERTFWGKLAVTLWSPGKTAVRYALRTEFLDTLGARKLFACRTRGIDPNKPLCSVCGEHVFDPYVRNSSGKPVCLPGSGYRR
jgi:formylmethanofuran dehydrogenase subunit E